MSQIFTGLHPAGDARLIAAIMDTVVDESEAHRHAPPGMRLDLFSAVTNSRDIATALARREPGAFAVSLGHGVFQAARYVSADTPRGGWIDNDPDGGVM